MPYRIRQVGTILGLWLAAGLPPAAAGIDEYWTADLAGRPKAEATAESLLQRSAEARAADVRQAWGRQRGDPVSIAVAALEVPSRTSAAVALIAALLADAPEGAPEAAALRPFATDSAEAALEAARLAGVKSLRDGLPRASAEGLEDLERRLVAVSDAAPAPSLAAVEARLHAGRAAARRSDVAGARRHWQEAAARARAVGWSRAALECAVRAGRAAIEAGDGETALRELRAAIDGPLGDRSTVPSYLARLDAVGLLLARRDWAGLLEAATTYDAWVRERSPDSPRAPFHFARARATLGLGRLVEAAAAGEAAIEAALGRRDTEHAARYATDLLRRLHLAGAPALALRLGERVRGAPGVPEHVALAHEAATIELLSAVDGAAGVDARLDAALVQAQRLGAAGVARALRRVRAFRDARDGRPDAALSTLLALEAEGAATADPGALLDRIRIVSIAIPVGRWDLVDARIDSLVATRVPDGDVATRARIDVLRAAVLAHRGDHPGAGTALDRAVEAARGARDRFLGSALLARAQHHLAGERDALALDDAVGAAEARLAESAGLLEEDDWRTSGAEPPELAIGMAAVERLAAHPPTAEAAAEGAHRLLDAIRGRALRRVLVGDGTSPPPLPPDLAAAERSSAADVVVARAALSEPDPGPLAGARVAPAARLLAALVQRDAVLATIRRTGGLAALALEPPTTPLAAVRDALAPDAGFVAWYAAPSLAGALVVRRTGAAWIPLPQARAPDALDGLVRWARARAGGSQGEPGLARETASTWLAPLLRVLEGARTLVVALDPRMGAVPVDAWIDPAAPDGPRLVQRLAVAHVPGAGAWLALRSAEPAAPSGVLAIGRPLPAAEGYEDLLESEREARDVAAAAASGERVLLTGEAATLARATEALVAKAGAWRWIHVAAHGIPDAVRPRSGGILLARGERLDGDRLFRMRVPAAVVVLSACESGADEAGAAEGPLSLARPWLVAGASRVVTAIGEVPDALAAEMMVRFARAHWVEGLPVAEALASAKRTAIAAGGAAAAPRVWAAFVLHGIP